MKRTLPLWVAAIWWGSLSTLGFFVVPMLFANLPSPTLAGNMAAKLFTAQTAVSAGCAMILLLLQRSDKGFVPEEIAQSLTLYVMAGALLALLVEFGVAPHIIARDNMALWHGVGSGMYLGQWICASVTFGKLAKRV